jgi:hypothetical protein
MLAIHLDHWHYSHHCWFRDSYLHVVEKILFWRNRFPPLLDLHRHMLHILDSQNSLQRRHAANKVCML